MPDLHRYHAKRDFRVTSEPRGHRAPAKAKGQGGIFVVQKHDARRLHYDLRLEFGGVLWSWAVTRGPSLDPSERRLAVHVEDHPVDYASFEGVIPEGEYGAGSVIVWDEGTWTPERDPAEMMKKGHIDFELHGEKLNGRWHLVRLRPRPGEKRDNWLLIKSDDDHADRKHDILEDEPGSVKSGLEVEEVAKQPDARRWHSNRKAKNGKAKAGPKAIAKEKAKPARKAGAATLPRFIEPCLAHLETMPPSGEAWVHEVKFDGYRLQAHVATAGTKLYTRKGLDWTERFGKPIVDALAGLDVGSAVIDGEAVVLADNGVSSFAELQLALSERRFERMIFYAFDLLWLDGKDLREEPLLDRKERLRDLLSGLDEQGELRFSEHFTEPGRVMLEHACRMGLEGVVSKRADAPYRSGRGHDWVKSKCTLRQEFVIAGYQPSDAAGRHIRSLVMGYHKDGKLVSVGNVGTGFSGKITADLKKKLDRLKTKTSPFSGVAARAKNVVWVKPELVAEIEFRSWTRGGNIRQASFQGLREDKPAAEIVMEKPDKPAAEERTTARKAANSGSAGKSDGATGATETPVKLSNPAKELWPDEHVTKKDLLEHYELVWPRMEQFVVNRPLALVRAPDGIHGQRFFQKHSMPGMSAAIHKSHDPEDNEEILFIKDFDGLASLVQLGVVEVHVWGSTVDRIGTPDQFVFDLDPDEGLDVEDVRKAAMEFHDRLDELGLANFVKVSGGKGYHIIVPLKPKADWDTVKSFTHDFAQAMAQAAPDRYTPTLSKKARKGKIFIDYLRNGRGSTTVAAYSSRAKKGATVSIPVTWEMIGDGLKPDAFSIGDDAIRKRLKAADPWADFFAEGKPLSLK
jgi:bifunctional non-homologous end joining protein LigD